MIRKSDIKWWILEARKHPDSAPKIIGELARRLIELDKQNEDLRNEIIRIQQHQAPVETNSAQVQSLRRQVEVLKGIVDGQSDTENMIIFLSEQLAAARTSVARLKDVAKQGRSMLDKQTLLDLCAVLAARPHDELLMLTDTSHGIKRLATDIQPLVDEEHWPQTSSELLTPGGGEPGRQRLTVAVAVSEPPRLWTIATQRGYVQRFVRVAMDRQISDGTPLLVSPLHNDPPVAIVNGERGDIMLLTRWGEAVRFPQHTIDVQGSLATELDHDDRVVAAVALVQDIEVLILTNSGYAGRYNTEKTRALAKPGAKSRRIFLARDVMTMLPCPPRSQLLSLSYAGKLSLTPASDIPLLERAGQGNQLSGAGRDPILAATLLPEEWL